MLQKEWIGLDLGKYPARGQTAFELHGYYCEVNVPYQVGVSRSENLDKVFIAVAVRKLQLSPRAFNVENRRAQYWVEFIKDVLVAVP